MGSLRSLKKKPKVINMTISDIVKEFLERNGFDGLFVADTCACSNDDLFPCGESSGDCTAGYRQPCTCGEDHDFHIGGEKL